MLKKTMLGALMLVVLSSTAWAQTPKVEFTGIIGWTLADGVSGDPVTALDGNVYDRVDPQDSVNFGFSLGSSSLRLPRSDSCGGARRPSSMWRARTSPPSAT